MGNKAALYFYTVKNMKPSQISARLRIKLGMGNPMGAAVGKNVYDVQQIAGPKELDFDPVFLERFPVEELMNNKLTILHSSKKMDWKSTWEFEDKSALWNFNLHYFEYLFPLVKAYRDSGDLKYLNKSTEIITGWIEANPVGKAPAWSSYPTALRIVTWISYYGYVKDDLPENFRKTFLESLHSQYDHLSKHLEKDILGNHYFEDLKSLVLAALFFRDGSVFQKALELFKAECREEILPDGMHFELSPMYHKIIFEGVLRTAIALRSAGKADDEIEAYLQPMLNVAYSFEDGLDRIPLFNDGGNNVAKSLGALIATAKDYFDLEPHFAGRLKDSGFYIFEKEVNGHRWKLIVDAGQPGPKYIPGHAHCDAMSFELFRDGKPVAVNCGTYAYQCEERSFFRSTAAHNTVTLNGVEQSQCWGAFRLAKRSNTKVLDVTDHSITMGMTDQKGQTIQRQIVFRDGLVITDTSDGNEINSYLHFLKKPEEKDGCLRCDGLKMVFENNVEAVMQKYPYAEDYGDKSVCYAVSSSGVSEVCTQIR